MDKVVNKNKIKPIRQKIDAIDHQILKLIQKRGSLAQKIGDLKGLIDSKIPFYKPSREAEIIRNISKLNEGPISDKKIKYIFKEIISSCLALEEELKTLEGEVYSFATDILRTLNIGEFAGDLIPISNLTGEGMVNLQAALSRIINLGEEVED